ncbi:MAG: hypothetical protein WB804_08585 [Candidatus Dormiibacterota bacterium]
MLDSKGVKHLARRQRIGIEGGSQEVSVPFDQILDDDGGLFATRFAGGVEHGLKSSVIGSYPNGGG